MAEIVKARKERERVREGEGLTLSGSVSSRLGGGKYVLKISSNGQFFSFGDVGAN